MNIVRRSFLAAGVALPLLVTATGAWASQTTINFWTAWDPSQADAKAGEAAIAAFEKANPDIKIKTQVIAYDALHDKLVTAIAGGDAPDLSWGLIEWFGELNKMGALADLTSQAQNWSDYSSIYPNVIKTLSIDGKLKALPNYLGLRALLYHSDMLKAAGVSEPPKTWDELMSASSKILKKTGKPGFGIAGKGVRSPQELIMYLAQNGLEIATKMPNGKYRNTWGDKPEEMKKATEVFAFYKEMQDTKTIAPDAASWGWEQEDNNFALGQYAMVVDGSWMKGRNQQNPKEMKDVLVTQPPAGEKAATFFEVAPIYIFKTKHEDATWKFASYMLSKKVQEAMYPDRSPRSDVAGDAVWGKPFTSLAPIGISFPPIPLGSITRDMEESIGRVLINKEDPKEVAQWLSEAINKGLKRSGQLSN